jgi:hypothetical protein
MLTALLLRLGLGEKAIKFLVPVIELAVVLLAVWLYGQYQYREGKADATAVFQKELADYEQRLKDLRNEEDRARQRLVFSNDKTLTELSSKLDAAEARSEKTKIVVQEVTKYVTPKADAACNVPVGAIRVLDTSTAAERSGEAPGIPEGQSEDVDAPSGIALSAVTGIVADNLRECVVRGEVIRAWQDWYDKSSKDWETYRSTIGETELPHF